MSWKGVKKTLSRLPHQFKTRNGSDDVTQDAEFNILESRFKELVICASDLYEQVNAYRDHLADMLETQYQCANNLSGIFGLADLDIGHTRQLQDIPPEIKQAVQDYETTMEYCNTETRLLLDEIDAKVVRPVDHFQTIIKTIDKTIIKRHHKLIDFDRHRVSYVKYSAIKEPSPSEEKNMSKLKAYYENAAHDYNHFNDMLKSDLDTFLDLSLNFIHPIVEYFYDIQSRTMGSMYGIIYNVIEQNPSAFTTWDMGIEDGYIFRSTQFDIAEEIENLDLLNTGSQRGIAQSSRKDHSSQYGHNLAIQGKYNNSSSSIYGNHNSNEDGRYDSAYCSSHTEAEYNQHNNTPPRPQLSLIYQKSSLSPNIASNVQYTSNNNKPTPPPLAKKPLLSQYSSFTNNTKTPPLPSTPRPSNTPKQDNRYALKRDLEIQTKSSGYEEQSSSYFSAATKTPASSSAAAVIESRAVSPLSSPFSDEQQIMVIKKKRAPPPPPPRATKKKVFVEALYDYNASQDGDLSFSSGDRIEVIEKSDTSDDWWKGCIDNKIGMFPANYVRHM